MRLRALEVQGFKTFPDKTKLTFTDGITAVVGPNGSGKSNISDAIRWVLGEQSAKSLRCSRMEDVIFNGTQQRKRTGYAQVTLSIDNSDRSLPFDGDEVAVTRRFYRSGNSEYLINNTNVRLQDIHELFMDTGLGRDGYSMIGQGKIDSIVSTKSEDRREIFEEAAGISRFRYKKAEAERRLDKTEENLVRLRDILSELEGRVEPLRIQSEKAKAYLSYAQEKRGLEIALWLKTLEKSSQQLRAQEDKLAVARAQYEDTEKTLSDIEAESEDIFQKQSGLSAQADECRRRISKTDEQTAEKKSRLSVLQNDILHNEQTIERIHAEMAGLEQSGVTITKEIKEKEKQIEQNREKQRSKTAELEKHTRALESLRGDESRSGEKLDELNGLIADLTRKASDEKVGFMTAAASIDELTGRTDVLENQVKAKESQMATLRDIIDDYQVMLTDCRERYGRVDKALAQRESLVGDKQEECEAVKEQADQLALDSDQLFRKAKMLEELERNLEGFAHSVKTVMREAKKGGLSGIRGPVSRVIKTSPEYNVAIEIALGAAMQNIVTETDQDAKQAIAFLKKRDGGRATFLPMATIKGRDWNEQGLEDCEGFIGIASQLCTCEDCYKGILSNLLGRIVVADNLDRAVAIAKKYSYRFRVVTLDGQVVNAGGSLTGGSLAKNTGLLGRASEIETIRRQAQEILQSAEAEKTRWQEKRRELSAELQQLEEDRKKLSDINEERFKIEAEIKARKTELDSIGHSYQDVKHERETVSVKLAELDETMKRSRGKYDAYCAEIHRNEELVQMLSGSRNEYVRKRESITEKSQEIRIDLLAVEKDITAAQNEIDQAVWRRQNAEERIGQNRREAEMLGEKNAEIRETITKLTEEIRSLTEQASQCGREIETLNQERIALEKRSSELRKTERDKTSERENLGGELARLEERRNYLQKQYDDITANLWEEYELTRREAEQIAVPIEEPGKAQRRLSELKQKIKSLGSVNVSAIEEYKEVSERYAFLKEQIGDVEKSKSELIRLIGELTKQMRDIFLDRFRLINEHFASTFVELFGGGKASLSLSDPENVLTSGIEIAVEPPGKIVSHIELLSGGEKALVAIALYFAIMKVSPPPFCVMDEIEAALDDVNVYRFASYLRRMNDNTQFICITHRRGTMEEADVLYGVTMQDRGISKLLELRASEIEAQLQEA